MADELDDWDSPQAIASGESITFGPHANGLTGRSITVDPNVSPDAYRGAVAGYLSTDADQITEGFAETSLLGEDEPKKKKKKKKSKSKNKAISGFEEFYADVPITPEQHEEETNDTYHPSRPVAVRIEFAIQRYRARRKFDSTRENIFNKYLTLGGIDTSPKMFSGGIDAKNLADHDARAIADMAAIDAVSRDKIDAGQPGAHWTVDFEGIAKCFFSSRAPALFEMETSSQISSIANVIRNFLNYLLLHNVCPEYTDDINAARTVCDRAVIELSNINGLNTDLPGDFNIACAILYGNSPQTPLTSESGAWAKDIVMTGLSAYATDEQIAIATKGLKVVKSAKNQQLELTEIIRAPDAIKDWYAEEVKSTISPLGKIRTKMWIDPYAADEDYTDDEDIAPPVEENGGPYHEFWVKDSILELFSIGMKWTATVHELNNGIVFFDELTALLANFFTNLDAELMVGWRKPEEIPEGQATELAENKDDDDEADD